MGFFSRHHDWPWNEASPSAIALRDLVRLVISNQEIIMIDTSKILAAVARERSELAGWKTLSAGKDKVIADTAAALKVATDALAAAGADTAALAKVQADLDQASNDLNNDSDVADAVINANVTAAPVAAPVAAPAPAPDPAPPAPPAEPVPPVG